MEQQLQQIKKPIKLRNLLPPGFLNSINRDFKYFCKGIKGNLKEENYEIMAITGYAGIGKSQLGAIAGALIDDNYEFNKNICFIPTATEVEKLYLSLPMYSFLHLDEASRSIHKHKWYEKTQQKLVTMYDTERENHYLCTALIMPRFQNFTENFRNFFIKYWINIVARGIAIVYRRDEDKDTKDPWNLEENFKLKNKYWRSKRVFEKTIADIIRTEQKTKNYWFYFQIPEIPIEVWQIYKNLKADSRAQLKEIEVELEGESFKDRTERERKEKWKQIISLWNAKKSYEEIAVEMNLSSNTVRRFIKEIGTYNRIKGDIDGFSLLQRDNTPIIYNQDDITNIEGKRARVNKIIEK